MSRRLKLNVFVAGAVFLLGIAGTHPASDKQSSDEPRPITVDLMTTSSDHSEAYNPGGTIVVVGGPREYYLSDGSKWSTGAGIFQRGLASLDYAQTDGDNIRYVLALIPVSEGIILGHTDYDQGNHCAQGTLGLVGELQIQAKRGSPVGVMSGLARISSNDPISGCRFNHYSAPVGAVVSFEVTYTLRDGKTFTEGLFDGGFTYSYSGWVNFANPISVPKPISLRIIGPGKAPEGTSIQYTAVAEYDSGIGNKDVTDLAVWQVAPDIYASIDSNGVLITKKLPHSKEEFTIYVSYTDVGVTIQEEKKIQCFQNLGPSIIYVEATATGANDGSSWENAYNFLQDALADAYSAIKPVEIRVAQGTYRPDEDTLHRNGRGDRYAAFQVISGVTMKGGYAGFGQPDPDVRGVEKYETVLSGDLGGDDLEGLTPSQLQNHPTRDDNSYHVVTVMNVSERVTLDGVTIAGGNANNAEVDPMGGGLFALGANVVLFNCIIKDNSAEWGGGGGGLFLDVIHGELTSCRIVNNSACDAGGGLFLGGLDATLSGCTFSDNLALLGGAVVNGCESTVMTDCQFTSNSASGPGSGGGAVFNLFSPLLMNCTFVGNRADNCDWESSAWQGGGAMYNDGSKPKLLNCRFIGNFAQYRGGAINSVWGDGGPMAINCTFVGNSAGSGGAICNQDYASAQVRNSIVWANLPNQVSAATAVTYSDVQGGCLGQGNIDIDPCFVDAGGSDYHLLPDSPCINAGDPGLVAGPNDVDMDGEARVMLGRVDMGADEFNPFAAEFVVVRRERVERTVFEYECEVVLENISRFAVKNVSLEMAKVSENMTIVDPEVNFSGAEIAARASARSVDTCTFRVDRAEAIDPAGIIWRVTAELTDTGAKMEHTLTSLLALDPPRSAAADFEGLAALADNWLWVGTPGGIDEDTIPDGRVNLADFARLAQQWGTD